MSVHIPTTPRVKLIAVPDSFGYWKVVRADDPTDAVMTGLDEHHAKRWAHSTQENVDE